MVALLYHCLLMFFNHHRKQFFVLGCSQVVRQRFLVSCTVGSNPATPATPQDSCDNLFYNYSKLLPLSHFFRQDVIFWICDNTSDNKFNYLKLSFTLIAQ